MNQQIEIVIKTSPIIFLKRLIFIELFWAFLTTWLSIEINFPQLFEELQLDRVASFTIIVTLIVTSLQIFIVAVAFITWYFDAYKVDQRKITHQRGNFFGVSDIAPTQALTDVKVHQSRLGRTFNYGNLELVSVDSSRQAYLKNIPNPSHHAALIKALIPPPSNWTSTSNCKNRFRLRLPRVRGSISSSNPVFPGITGSSESIRI